MGGRSRSRHRGNPDGKRSFGRKKKRERRFMTKSEDDRASKRPRSSSSSRKLQGSESEASDTQNRIIDISILFSSLSNSLCCAECHGRITVSEEGQRGLGFKIVLKCSQCHEVTPINSSKLVGQQGNAYEVNRRSVLASRALGQGLAGLSTFCGIMDLPSPVAHSFYDRMNVQLAESCEKIANASMHQAVQKESQLTPNASDGLVVSGDGSWRKRGFSSLQGIVSVIGNRTGQVIDVNIKNSFCKACSKWENKQDSEAYKDWYEEHAPQCPSNHEGSAGNMEVSGIMDIFKNSVTKYGVRYKYYIGDGDSKVFSTIANNQPYGEDFLVEKKECVGHVQKRMGTRLRNLKKTLGGTKLDDGKSIGGRGRLTGAVIEQLSKYYGNAIRANTDSLEKMSESVWATYYHKISTDDHPQHHLCPAGSNSWCKWQKAKALNQLSKFHHSSSIPVAIMEKLKPIYEDLSKPELLSRCIGGFTQNNNESFNQSVWKLVTKTSFSGMTVLKIGVYIAVCVFNDGRAGFLKIMKDFEINPGSSAMKWVRTSDDSRIFHAERKAEENTLEARRERRVRLQGGEESYTPGGF